MGAGSERRDLLRWTFQLNASLDITLTWGKRMSEHPFNAICKNPVLLLGRFHLLKSLTWYINHLCMCVLKLFKAFSIRNASLLISTNSLTQNVFLNSQKGSFCPAFKYEKCGFKFTFHLEMQVIMNPSCLGFAFQFSVTDFKSPAEASARADAGAQSNNRAEPGVRGRSKHEVEQREMLGITEEGAEKVAV